MTPQRSSDMAKNILACQGKLSQGQIDLLIVALEKYLKLPPGEINERAIWFQKRQVLRSALINALRKNHLAPGEALEIASMIDVSLYDR
jgi:hypothetical protein